jgi:hypothetical protein
MRRLITACVCFALLTASSVLAISPSDDLLIAAAARTNRWIADLYIVNPGATSVTVDVMWLERDQANPTPQTETFTILGGETLILDDVLFNDFDMSTATGALRIHAPGGSVTANLVVYTGAGSPDGTYGSGFEAIPASSATSAGESTTIAGMVLDDDFYTNLFALAGANGVTMDLDLLDPNGTVLDTVEIVLEAYEPWLSGVANLWDEDSFANGTARASVTAGSMVMLGSKVDRASKDPTTLEQEFGAGADSVDGIYQFTIWDQDPFTEAVFAAGSEMVIADGMVIEILGTYMNFQKLNAQQDDYACPVLWGWGWDLPLSGVAVEDFASGFQYTEDHRYYPEGGEFTWTLTLTFDDNVGFSGTIDAVGNDFSGSDIGCNGAFPQLQVFGGKSN